METNNHSAHCKHHAKKKAPTTSDPTAIYTCPMHPEVQQVGPGSCPKCGMALEPLHPTTEADDSEYKDMKKRFIVSVLFAIPVMFLAMGDMLPGKPVSSLLPAGWRPYLELLLSLPVCLWAAYPFYERAIASLKSRNLNMFTLIGLGVSVAFIYSTVAVLAPDIFPDAFKDASGHVAIYFEAAVTIVALILLGQVLELKARSQTNEAVKKLLGLAAKTAKRINQNGDIEEVGLEHIQVGDRLKVFPGDKVPLDGVIIEGKSTVDESMISGEPVPVEKEEGSQVVGATINGTGSFIMRAEKVGAETLLARIVQMVSEAQRSRAPIQKLADKVSAYFVPAVVLVAIFTFIIWSLFGPDPAMSFALVNAVAVLIIACPCALGLATPISIMVSTGRGAQQGILFKNAEAIEVMRDVTTLVVDKTGTLTEGKPRLVTVKVTSNISEEDFLVKVASLENSSEHPLAQSIVKGALEKGIKLVDATDFDSITGKGVRGKVSGSEILLGNKKLMLEQGFDLSEFSEEVENLRGEGQTVMFAAIDNKFAGFIGVMDPIKESTVSAIQALHKEGLKIVMLTGDSETTAKAVAKKLGIEKVIADVLPEQKVSAVQELLDKGELVAMAGDGINDAPALAKASVGIAMGTGTDVAMESAGVTLVKGDLNAILKARQISQETMKNIKQNLFFAFIYNIAGVPIAAGILYPFIGVLLNPMIAAGAMSLSSVSVIVNALRLKKVSYGQKNG